MNMRIDHIALKPLIAALMTASLAMVPTAQAGERENLEQLRATTLNLIQLLVQQGVLSKENADLLVEQAKAGAIAPEQLASGGDSPAEEGDKKTVRVQYVPEHVKKQLRDEIREEVLSQAKEERWAAPNVLPDWLDRIAWEGDLRLRYEKNLFPEGNETPLNLAFQGADINNTSEDRERWRIRARLGANIRVSDAVTGGLRIVTGGIDDPVSPNQTLGNSGNKFSFALDRAYLNYQPTSWLKFTGGRMANPWYSTDLVWDPDMSFDGVAATIRPKFSDRFTAFATIGAFPIEEVEESKDSVNDVSAKDKWLYGAQTGFEWVSANKSTFKLGLAYYDFSNVVGVQNEAGLFDQDRTAPQFHQKGNTMFVLSNPVDPFNGPFGLASDFRELNLTATWDIAAFSPVHVVISGDYVKNIGFDEEEVRARNPVSPVGGDTGWMAKLLVGMPETTQRHDWNVYGIYKRLETNAVLDAFTDSDFHLGGTNTEGWIMGANYGLDKNTWLSMRWLSADEIEGSPLSIDVLQVDINAKF